MHYISALCKNETDHPVLPVAIVLQFKEKKEKKYLGRCINHSRSPAEMQILLKRKDAYASVVENVKMCVATKAEQKQKPEHHSTLLVNEVLSHCLKKDVVFRLLFYFLILT